MGTWTRRLLLLGFVAVLSVGGSFGRGTSLAQGCGGETFMAGAPRIEQREAWRQADEGLGSFIATLVTDDVVVATAIMPGCALGIDSIRAFDLTSGDEVWSRSLDELPEGAGGSEPVGFGEVVFVTGAVFGGEDDEDERTVTAIEAATGEERWTWSTPGQPLVEVVGQTDDQAFVLASDQTSTLLALDAATGDETWSVTFEGFGSDGAIDEEAGVVYVDGFAPGGIANGLFLAAFEVDGGDERWRMDVDGANDLRLVAHDGNRTYVTVSGENGTTISALSSENGGETWSSMLPDAGAGASWSVGGDAGFLYAIASGEEESSVVGIDPSSGDEAWTADLDMAVWYAGAGLGAGELVVQTSDPESGFADGALALDRASGEERWQVDLPGLVGLLVTDDVVYVTHGEPGEGQALRALDVESGDERWNLGFPEFARLHILDLAGETLLLSGSNDDEAALIAIATD